MVSCDDRAQFSVTSKIQLIIKFEFFKFLLYFCDILGPINQLLVQSSVARMQKPCTVDASSGST